MHGGGKHWPFLQVGGKTSCQAHSISLRRHGRGATLKLRSVLSSSNIKRIQDTAWWVQIFKDDSCSNPLGQMREQRPRAVGGLAQAPRPADGRAGAAGAQLLCFRSIDCAVSRPLLDRLRFTFHCKPSVRQTNKHPSSLTSTASFPKGGTIVICESASSLMDTFPCCFTRTKGVMQPSMATVSDTAGFSTSAL